MEFITPTSLELRQRLEATLRPNEVPTMEGARRTVRSTWQRVWDVIQMIFAAPFRLMQKALDYIVQAVEFVVTWTLRIIVEGPVWLVEKIFGVDTSRVRRQMRNVLNGIGGALRGLINGVIRLPSAAIGMTLRFMQGFLSFRWIYNGKAALDTLLIRPLASALGLALTPFFMGIKGISDAMEPRPRRLTDEERSQLSRLYSSEVLDSIRIVQGNSIMWRIVGGNGQSAMTLGNTIYVNPNSEMDLTALTHEVVHTLQYRSMAGGIPTFLIDYLCDYITNRAIGMDNMEAYENLWTEIEAFGLQHLGLRANPDLAQMELFGPEDPPEPAPSSTVEPTPNPSP